MPPGKSLTRRAYAPGPEGQRCAWSSARSSSPAPLSTRYSYAVAGDATEIDRDLSEFTNHADRRAWQCSASDSCWRLSSRCVSVSRPCAPCGRTWRRSARARPSASTATLPEEIRAAAAGAECADRIQSRDRRSRPHPCRQSRARAEDAAQRHRQRSADAGRAAGQQGGRAGRDHAHADRPPSRPGAGRGAIERDRRRHRRRSGAASAEADARPHLRGARPRRRGWLDRPGSKFQGEKQDFEEMVGNCSTMPANGQARG